MTCKSRKSQLQRHATALLLAICGIFALTPALSAAQHKIPKQLEDALAGPMAGVEEIVFASRQLNYDGHWYANFGYYAENAERKAYRAMGRLCKLNLRTGEVTVLHDDPKGTVRDPQVHYDGRKIIFSYRKAGADHFNLYEINTDGTGLRQITSGPHTDIEPTYMPDGSIVFCSNRCNRWVNCWLTQVAIMYRCNADGSDLRPISSNGEHENTPWPLPDGRILYQRWEYIDRSQVHYHHLWTINPDGTGQMTYFGNFHPGIVMIDAKPIPGTEKVVTLFSPGHGRKEHAGDVTILTPKTGPDDRGSARTISKGANFRDPYPFSEDCFLVARDTRLLLMDGRGQTTDIYRLPDDLVKAGVHFHEPRPIMARPRERIIPSRIALDEPTGQLVLTDVYRGRNMKGVKRGEIKKLLIVESLPMPIHYTGGMEPLSYGGTFTLVRILGTVPVEPDGSAYMEVPALRSIFFVALDEKDYSVKRMQSFVTVMPGETTSCVGCHEQRTRTPMNAGRTVLQALMRDPSKIKPIEGIPDVLDFPRDVQPVLDKHCVGCHGYDATAKGGPRAGGVILTGDRGPLYSHSYYTLTNRRQFADGRNRPQSNLAPRTIGTSASPIMKKLEGGHNEVKATAREIDTVRYWIEAGAPYPGTYAALGCGMIGAYAENNQDKSDAKWPETIAAAQVVKTRCAGCHTKVLPLPLAFSDNRNIPPWHGQPGYVARHLIYNLTRPEKSLILLAPLAKKAGGLELCKPNEGEEAASVFADTKDPDYQKILAMCRAGKRQLDKIKRFDMPEFRPRQAYVREMKRYGILPVDLPANASIDVYATDRKYWESLWHRPADCEDPVILPASGQPASFSAAGPNLSAQIDKIKATDSGEIPRFAANSPFAVDYKAPIPKEPKRLWARSCLWEKAPDFVVEKWLTEKPETKGKYLLIEFWATWCSQCRRAAPLLNELHEKYKDRLAVIGVSDEDEQTVRRFERPKIEYNIAIDTQARMKKELAVTGIPHVIIIEPGGYVVWEGFPLLSGHKLTDEVVGRILTAGEKAKPGN